MEEEMENKVTIVRYIGQKYTTLQFRSMEIIQKWLEEAKLTKTRKGVLMADGNNKVTSQTSWTTLVLYVLNLLLYIDSTVTNNQITSYLTTNRRDFLQTLYGIS